MNSKKLLITGGKGQLASALIHHPMAKGFQLFPCDRLEFDITKHHAIEQAIKKFKPDIIINTAAYTAVDKAESEKKAAMQINYHAVMLLAIACQRHHIPLIHLSTDYVFDGKSEKPYSENDPVNPVNVYGESKRMGEEAVRQHLDQHIILRVSAVFSEYGHNFLKTILHLAKEKKELSIVSDQMTCPTYAGNIAEIIFSIIEQPIDWGCYHFCGDDVVSWHQFASHIANAASARFPIILEQIKEIKTKDYLAPASRPLFSVLDCSKLKTHLKLKKMRLQDGIELALDHLVPHKEHQA